MENSEVVFLNHKLLTELCNFYIKDSAFYKRTIIFIGHYNIRCFETYKTLPCTHNQNFRSTILCCRPINIK